MYISAIWQKFLVGLWMSGGIKLRPIKLGWTNVTARNFAVGQTLQSSKHWGWTNVEVRQTSRLDKRLGWTNVLVGQTSWLDKRLNWTNVMVRKASCNSVTVWLSKLKRVLKDWPMIATNYYQIYQLLTWPLTLKIIFFNLMV